MKKEYLYGLILCFIIITAFTACHKKKQDQDVVVTNTTTPTVTNPPVTPTITPVDTIDEPTPSVTETLDTVEELLTQAEALNIVQNKIDERGYFVELSMDNLKIGDKSYYVYNISDGSSVIEPNVIVDKVNGELLCYKSDGSTAPFSDFPLYTESVVPKDTSGFTKEDAYDRLSKLSAKTLGLPGKLQQYTIEYDEWTTNVKGVECYGINAFDVLEEKMTNMGVYYVALDGTKIFKFDNMLDDFVELVKD